MQLHRYKAWRMPPVRLGVCSGGLFRRSRKEIDRPWPADAQNSAEWVARISARQSTLKALRFKRLLSGADVWDPEPRWTNPRHTQRLPESARARAAAPAVALPFVCPFSLALPFV